MSKSNLLVATFLVSTGIVDNQSILKAYLDGKASKTVKVKAKAITTKKSYEADKVPQGLEGETMPSGYVRCSVPGLRFPLSNTPLSIPRYPNELAGILPECVNIEFDVTLVVSSREITDERTNELKEIYSVSIADVQKFTEQQLKKWKSDTAKLIEAEKNESEDESDKDEPTAQTAKAESKAEKKAREAAEKATNGN